MKNSQPLKILCVGPLPPPIHGQSLAFKRFYESINDNNKFLVNTSIEQNNIFYKIIGTFIILASIFHKIIFFRIDVIYFTCSRSFTGSIKDVVLINLAALKNIKIVNHLHGSDFYDFLHSSPKWYQRFLFYSYSKVSVSIVLLESMKNQFIDFSNMDLEVVANFYDQECDEVVSVKQTDNINLLYLSNIISSKGVFELIDAFEILSKRHDNIYLSIAGGYMSDEDMSFKRVRKEFILSSSRNDRITYFGKIFDKEKVKLLQRSDIFVLPSYYKSEAFPISIIEAMACENAIITTNYKYLPEVVGRENGVLVNPKSVDSLVKGIEIFLNDIEELRKVQKHNKIEAKNKYSLNKYLIDLSKIVMTE
jgi:glycosyltransferase involved in cell wall biosynthesis